jgi:hypothetical protein
MKKVLVFVLLVLLFGCIVPNQAFQFTDISSPCSVIAAGEVRAMYGFKAIEEKSFSKEDEYSFCLYSGQTTANESNLLSRNQIMLMYIPFAQNNTTIIENYEFNNETEYSFISERDLGIGDQSFLAVYFVKSTGQIKHMSVVVFEDDSAIIATDAGYQLSGVDQKNKEKLRQLAALALSRLTPSVGE